VTYKLTTGLASLALFFVAFSASSLEVALLCALLAFLAGMLFWGRVFQELADRRERGAK
jgi:hypothetical protein